MEKVRLSGREALVSIRWELKLLASKREALPAIGLKKGKVIWSGGYGQHPVSFYLLFIYLFIFYIYLYFHLLYLLKFATPDG